MSTVRCPSCGDSFRVPDLASPIAAMAQCPWCSDRLPLAQLQRYLPPLVPWLDADAQPLTDQPATTLRSAGTVAQTVVQRPIETPDHSMDTRPALEELVLEESALEESAPFGDTDPLGQTVLLDEFSEDTKPYGDEFEYAVSPRPLAAVCEPIDEPFVSAPETPTLIARPARLRRRQSPLRSMVWIVVGGLMAFPLAGGILALAGKPLNLGIWPFDGETLATPSMRQALRLEREEATRMAHHASNMQYARNDDAIDDHPADGAASLGSLSDDWHQSLDDDLPGTAPPSLDPLRDDLATAAADFTPPAVAPAAMIEPVRELELQPVIEPDPMVAVQPIAEPEPMVAEQPVAEPEPVIAAQPAVEPEAVVEMQPVVEPDPVVAVQPVVTPEPVPTALPLVSPEPVAAAPAVSAELANTLDAANLSLAQVDAFHKELGNIEYRKRMAGLFASVAALGLIATPADAAAIDEWIDALDERDLTRVLPHSAASWLRMERRYNDGIFATGVLRRSGDTWRLEWSGPEPLVVRLADGLAAEPDTNVLILGRILPAASEAQPAGPVAPQVEITYLRRH